MAEIVIIDIRLAVCIPKPTVARWEHFVFLSTHQGEKSLFSTTLMEYVAAPDMVLMSISLHCKYFKMKWCQMGKDCPFTHAEKEDRSRSLRRRSRGNTFSREGSAIAIVDIPRERSGKLTRREIKSLRLQRNIARGDWSATRPIHPHCCAECAGSWSISSRYCCSCGSCKFWCVMCGKCGCIVRTPFQESTVKAATKKLLHTRMRAVKFYQSLKKAGA